MAWARSDSGGQWGSRTSPIPRRYSSTLSSFTAETATAGWVTPATCTTPRYRRSTGGFGGAPGFCSGRVGTIRVDPTGGTATTGWAVTARDGQAGGGGAAGPGAGPGGGGPAGRPEGGG